MSSCERDECVCEKERVRVCMCARKVTFTLSFCSSRMNGKTIKASNGQAGANPTKLSKQLCNSGNLLPPCRNLASILFWASLFSKRTIKGSSDLHTNHSLQVVLLRVLCRWIQGSIGAEWIAVDEWTHRLQRIHLPNDGIRNSDFFRHKVFFSRFNRRRRR